MTAHDNVTATKVAILGLGMMGGRAAAAVTAAGYATVGFDPSEAAAAAAAGDGVRLAGSAADAVADADVVLVSVPRPEHVLDLAGGALQAASPGTIVADLSTIDPATARHAAELLAPHKVTYLDCPVLGRPAGCGSWTLVAGGDADAVTRVTPMLEQTVAKRVARVGDVGAGSVVKILNNLMFGAINAVTAEALDLASRAGIGMDTFVDAVLDSGAATVSNLFRDIGPRMAAGDDDPVFALDLLAKDNELALALARECGAAAPIASSVARLNAAAVDLGYGSRDSAAVLRAYQHDRTA